jgi:DNA polymerase-1
LKELNMMGCVMSLRRWYGNRREVLEWQQRTTAQARREKPTPFVTTLLGRTRPLPDINSRDRRKQGHAQRASINTPIQVGRC